MRKLPFSAGIFWTVLVIVAVLAVLTFVLLAKFTEYERTTTDMVGTTISSILFAYLLHLWLLPAEYLHPDEEYEDEYDEDGEYEEGDEGVADNDDDADRNED